MTWTFGEPPLVETTELAPLLRRLVGIALSAEVPSTALRTLIDDLVAAERSLAELAPSSPTPRVGADHPADGRVYLDHARNIGAFNPAFPVYEITVEGSNASGSVEFPIIYEGPPGIVHGGFLGVFFDCVMQHHNCDLGVAGKSTSLGVRFRRPAPLLTPLSFDIERSVSTDRIESNARLLHGSTVLAEARMEAIAGDLSALPPVSARKRDR